MIAMTHRGRGSERARDIAVWDPLVPVDSLVTGADNPAERRDCRR